MKLKLLRNLLIILTGVTACLFIILFFYRDKSDIENKPAENISETLQPATTPTPAPAPVIKEFAGTKGIEKSCKLTDFFIYGTSLCMSFPYSDTEGREISQAHLVLRNAYTKDDGTYDSSDIYSFPLNTGVDEGVTLIKTYGHINDGILLENIKNGEYCMVLKLDFSDASSEYFTIEGDKKQSVSYYTVTKNHSNQKIDIGFSTKTLPYGYFTVSSATLPEDVYDIVIDPGHGGSDAGAVNGNYYESEIVLDYALDLKKALEAKGYKVRLTRDGSESKDAPMAYNMYDDDGRVNVACKSSAKLCLSLHLNSNADYVRKGGIQIYVSNRAESSFAQSLLNSIVTYSGTSPSPMAAFQIVPGVYARPFSQADIDESARQAEKDGYEPYIMDTTTDYYYMIRELGGIATGAYVDGRKQKYGTNHYTKSLTGVESYILELGFLSIEDDLQHILINRAGYVEGMAKAIDDRFNSY